MTTKTELQLKLKEFRTSIGLNQTNFANKLGVSQAAIANIESGNRDVSKALLIKIKEIYNVDLLSLNNKSLSIDSNNVIAIPFYSAKAAAGRGTELSDYPEKDVIYFDRRWLQAVVGHKPECLSLIRAEGDSMLPMIQDGDLLMVDDSIKEIIPNKTFVIQQEGQLRVKRLKTEFNGDVLILSNNTQYPTEIMNKETVIIGQVVWNGSKEYV